MSADIRVVELDPDDTGLGQRWERYVEATPEAGFYHSLAWRDVTCAGLGHRSRYLCALDARDEVCGVLPLFEVTGLFGRRLVSLPMRDRGGVAASNDAAARALLERAVSLLHQSGARYLEIKASEAMPTPWLGADSGTDWQIDLESWVTSRVDLVPGAEAIWSGLSKKNTRWSIKKARKNGIRVEQDASAEGMRTFYRLFVATRCAMGIPPFPAGFFEQIHHHVIAAGKGQLWLAWLGDQPVHGLVSFFSKDSYIPAYAAPQQQYRGLYPNELILWQSIEWAATNGFSVYDFGADSKLQEGLFAFKRKWGGVQHPMAFHYVLNGIDEPPNFDSSGGLYRLARKVWQRLPTALARPLGAFVTRQLS